MPKNRKSRYQVPNLERAIKILELLSQNPPGLSSTQIAQKLNFSRNSIFRITTTLIDTGYLNKNEESKLFQLSQKLLSLGYAAIGEQTLIEKALPQMRALRDKYGETVPLGILHSTYGLVVESIPGTFSFRYVLEPGKRFSLHTSASGKAIIAFLPDDEREELIQKLEYTTYNERTINSRENFRKYLEEVKMKGFALDIAEEIAGMHCIGSPIFNRLGYPIAAIWITGPSIRLDIAKLEKIGQDVKKYAHNISQSLGYLL
jgi:DNA-binding IclR family transcriptional regulator